MLELLAICPGETLVDATLGLGGHSLRFAEALGAGGLLIGIDADPRNIEVAKAALANAACETRFFHANFSELADVLREAGRERIDVLFADLGVSSTQLDEADRGFSFQQDGPLDMRMDPRLETSAADIVNQLKERELTDLLWELSQESQSRRIARRIIDVRREKRITTTQQLVEIICKATGVPVENRKQKIHPATRTFQALRIAVNRELESLEQLLRTAPAVLAPGARFGIISFHSIEDRPIKHDFRARKNERIYEILTKKPVAPAAHERATNPRSRSAKLRAVRRTSEPLAGGAPE